MYLTRSQIERLESLLRAATRAANMERAGFGFSGDTVTVKRLHGDSEHQREHTGNGTHKLDDFVKAETRLFRESWIVMPLEEIKEILDEAKARDKTLAG